MSRKNKGFAMKTDEGRAQVILLLALLVSCFIMFYDYLFGNNFMVFNDVGNDTWQQYIQQYATVINHLLQGNFTVWDFNNGLGTNMLSMNLFDPSLMILYLLGVLFGTQKMLYFISWMQVVRILLAGWAFYKFISMFSYRISIRTAIAYAWGMNGYLLVWGQHYQFGMITIYLPLLLMFCEKYLRKEKGRRIFPVMVAVTCIYSVYLSYMSLIIVGFYMIFRLWMMDMSGWKERIIRFLGGCVQILLGIGMACMIFLPSVATMVGVSGRIAASDQSLTAWLKEYLTPLPQSYYEASIMRLFSSNLQESYQLSDGRYEAFRNYYEDPVFYVSNIVLILAIQTMAVFWRSKEKIRVKLAVYSAAALMGFTVFFPLGGCIFNGFMYASHRHTFVFLPFFLLAGAWMWEYLLDGGFPSFLGLLVTAYLAERVFHLGYAQTLFTSYRKNILILAVTSALTILIAGIYPFLKRMKKVRLDKVVTYVLMFALVVNAVSEGFTSYHERVVLRKEDTALEDVADVQDAYDAEYYSKDPERFVLSATLKVQDYFREMYSENIQSALAYLEEKEDTFYRVEKDFSSGTIAMDALVQQYYGVSTYNSTLNKNFKEFLMMCYPDLFGADKAHVQFWEEADDNHLAAYFGVKYLLSKNPKLDASRYQLINQFGDIYVYENMLEANVAKFYSTAISEESFKKLYSSWCRREFLGEVIAVEDGMELENLTMLREINNAADDSASVVTLDPLKKHSTVTGRVEAETNGYMMFMIPFEQGWHLTVDGTEKEIMRGDLGFIACKVEAGNHEFELSFHTPMVKEGIVTAIIFWCLYGLLIYNDRKKKRKFI